MAGVCLSVPSVRAEITDVMKASQIDSMLAKMHAGDQVVHQRSAFSIFLGVREGTPGAQELYKDYGTIIHVRKGSGTFTVAGRPHDIAAGDVLHAPRNTPFTLDPRGGRIEFLALRVHVVGDATSRGRAGGPSATAPAGAGAVGGAAAGRGAQRQIVPDVIKKDVIDATFANNSVNQPIGTTGTAAYTTNYVIYAGRQPPWESHAHCFDIAFVRAGSGMTQVGGTIVNPKDDPSGPGEIRGTGVTGARDVAIANGDIVVVPRGTPHHQQPHMPRLGYMLVKVWTDE
jgi:mannose-6-phosphate isomerase-like protein (cupin superfamily)